MSKPLYLMHIGSEYAPKNKLQADVSALVPDLLHNVLTDNPELIARWVQSVLDALHAKHNRCKPLTLHRYLEPADMVEFAFIKMRHQNFRICVGDVCTIYFYPVNGAIAETLTCVNSVTDILTDAINRLRGVHNEKGGDDA
jgi:hypothetical protein